MPPAAPAALLPPKFVGAPLRRGAETTISSLASPTGSCCESARQCPKALPLAPPAKAPPPLSAKLVGCSLASGCLSGGGGRSILLGGSIPKAVNGPDGAPKLEIDDMPPMNSADCGARAGDAGPEGTVAAVCEPGEEEPAGQKVLERGAGSVGDPAGKPTVNESSDRADWEADAERRLPVTAGEPRSHADTRGGGGAAARAGAAGGLPTPLPPLLVTTCGMTVEYEYQEGRGGGGV